ncbi:preprotein translocase subunit SecA [Desulfobacca acetoxidans]|uniref:Protein translocase subunit SecA n=1 Tax=Desulfobacca acetoxidans (strain ATCC 700848 / DSM 11109 / ASRB2) TaxID=880072 RepID=F2NDY4_DESAR|nr:preprotein translocase subunit SecA [Desulfobacca acetoxidans]AEB10552.1 Protein translocase subunit secA [Desulfobacca acetoxidans DSM 11109]
MFGYFLKKFFGSKNERELRRMAPLVDHINRLEIEIRQLPDHRLQAKTGEFKERLAKGEALDDLLPEAFAVAREASLRVLRMRPFDVQLIGGIVLHEGKIAEMKTGEGKTLVAVLPVYLNALTGLGVHVVTVNDYLARRDSEWMGGIYRFLGLSVGVIVHGLNDDQRRQAYDADVTYGTNNEFGFDYLRDNMKFSLEDYVQREFNYAIVDEVDSILIDEARTPLIISGPAEESTELYHRINRVGNMLQRDKDYTVDEKSRAVVLTEAGVGRAEKIMNLDNLYDPFNIEILHHLNQSLKAHALFKKDVDYIVKDGQVIIVDEFTGRLMPGRRYSDGLHQALEAKEGVRIENENQTLASITFQNYFRMYQKLAGMTGTADTEAEEFKKIYNLEVMVVPTHKRMIRVDHPDAIYKSESEKFQAVVEEIKDCHQQGQPVLVGTTSIEKSERLSRMLKAQGIKHEVLNAKHHEKEAQIVAQAGQSGMVTIATNMAGRGTDIVLGTGVVDRGGLHIIGTERHESRRIDNQLRGRSGRQGDPGSSRFYLSLEDDLLRIFGSDRIKNLMGRLGMEDGQPIEHRMVSSAIERAQKRVEAHNFDIRKHLLEYDNVMNKQREVIYGKRREILGGEDLEEEIQQMAADMVDGLLVQFTDPRTMPEDWDLKGLEEALWRQFGLHIELSRLSPENLDGEKLPELLHQQVLAAFEGKRQAIGPEYFPSLQQQIMLQMVDTHWKDHLLAMDHLRDGIGLRGYAQVDPLRAYQKEGYDMFMEMMQRIQENTVRTIFLIRLRQPEEIALLQGRQTPMSYSHSGTGESQPVKKTAKKVGRNDPCPCGSGKKYKKCCGNKT